MATTTTNPTLSFVNTTMTNDTDSFIPCALFNGDHSKCLAIIGVRRAVSCVSILGCFFVIFLIWVFRKYVAFAQRLILYLSISGVFYDIVFMMGDEYEAGVLCTLQGFFTNLFIWIMLLWVCCVTFNLYMNAVWLIYTRKYEWAYCLVALGIPLIVSFLPLIKNHYGPAGPWCWITNDWGWRFGIWYFPLFILIGTMIGAYIHIIITVNRQLSAWGGTDVHASEQRKNKLKLDIKLLKRYPLIYICCSIFALINRIQNSVDPENPVFALMLLHALTAPLPGMLNAVVFCLDKDTASQLTWTQIKVALMTKRARRTQSQPAEYLPYGTDVDVSQRHLNMRAPQTDIQTNLALPSNDVQMEDVTLSPSPRDSTDGHAYM